MTRIAVALFLIPALANGAWTHIADGTAAEDTGTNTINPAWPTHITDDVGIVVCGIRADNQDLNTPAGYTLLQVETSAGRTYAAIFAKVALSAAEAAPAFTADGGAGTDTVTCQISTFRGGTLTEDVAGQNQHNAATDLTLEYPGITPTSTNTLVLIGVKHNNPGSTSTCDTPAGFTEFVEFSAQSGADQMICADYQIQTTATAVGSGTITQTGGGNDVSSAVVVALQESGGGGGGGELLLRRRRQ